MTTTLALLQEGFMKAGFGEQDFHNQTVLHPLGLALVTLLSVGTVLLPRKLALLPFLVMAIYVSPAQRVIIATLDFHFLRLLVLAGMVRVVARGEYRGFGWRRLDTLLVAWALASMGAQVIRGGSVSVFVYTLGRTYDFIGMYLYVRCVVRDWAAVEAMVKAMALLVIPVAGAFALERATGRNGFALFGGVPEFTSIRYERLRCQGPFPHPILAGCYFAAWLPLVASLLWYPGRRIRAFAGVAAMTVIVFTTASSTPATGFLAALIGLGAWVARRHLRPLRWSTVAALVALHIVMKAPVWHLNSRVSLSKGSTSYHRYLLIDNAIHRYDEWALVGVNSTRHWGHAQYDVTNQFVLEAVTGGALTLALFVGVVGRGFQLAGRLWRAQTHRSRQRMAWALGASLFTQCVMFIGVSISHSQQNLLVFFLVLGMLGSLADAPALAPGRSRRRATRPLAARPRAPRLTPSTG